MKRVLDRLDGRGWRLEVEEDWRDLTSELERETRHRPWADGSMQRRKN